MKDKSKKHDHKGTKILKLSIFASIMLAPLFAIGFKCAYATFNKNANQSYSDNYIQSTTKYTNDGQDIEGGEYVLTTYLGSSGNLKIDYTKVSIDWVSVLGASSQYNYDSFEMSQSYVYLYENNVRVQIKQFNQNNWQPIYFTNKSMSSNFSYGVYLITYRQDTLDNAFYYAVDQMKDNDLFTWTKNTALYTPINAMTSGLGITTDAIAVLLAYWLYITLIYVVFDIVIELFTYLSHLIMGNPIG